MVVWRDGTPSREFLYVDDMADACILIMTLDYENNKQKIYSMYSHVNNGTGVDISFADLAEIIAKVVRSKENIMFDTARPNGSFRKLMSPSLIQEIEWKFKFDLSLVFEKTYLDNFLNSLKILN